MAAQRRFWRLRCGDGPATAIRSPPSEPAPEVEIVKDKITVPAIASRKAEGPRVTMVTAYDFTFARLLDGAGVDILLVGDSLGMVVQGESSTIPVTMDEMAYHVRLVARARPRALVLGDMPFLSYQVSAADAVGNAGRLIKAGAEAVKLEGGVYQAATIEALVRAEIPVVGHVGLTPQAVHRMGGHRVQGRDEQGRRRVLEDARAVAGAGAFALVLEGVPLDLAREITQELSIPTIGIGAGPFCDGQVLVLHDLLGLSDGSRPTPRFVRQYAGLGALVAEATHRFCDDVQRGAFPCDLESYHAPGSELRVASEVPRFDTVAAMQGWAEQQRAAGLRIAFVPTMGFLHEGHLDLVREARRRADRVVVSIFVNPIQFDREEDLMAYPRDLDRDVALLRDEGVDAVYVPRAEGMYAEDFATGVGVDRLSVGLCGAHRAGHFRGVTTVVTKLFHAVRPHLAIFGEKDFQQLAIVRRMTRDLDFGIEVLGHPTVREADGLARSSRNARLSDEARQEAAAIPVALDMVRQALGEGMLMAEALARVFRDSIAAHASTARVEYAEIVDSDSLEPVVAVDRPAHFAIAVWIGGVRLIDNVRLDPGQASPSRLGRNERLVGVSSRSHMATEQAVMLQARRGC